MKGRKSTDHGVAARGLHAPETSQEKKRAWRRVKGRMAARLQGQAGLDKSSLMVEAVMLDRQRMKGFGMWTVVFGM